MDAYVLDDGGYNNIMLCARLFLGLVFGFRHKWLRTANTQSATLALHRAREHLKRQKKFRPKLEARGEFLEFRRVLCPLVSPRLAALVLDMTCTCPDACSFHGFLDTGREDIPD